MLSLILAFSPSAGAVPSAPFEHALTVPLGIDPIGAATADLDGDGVDDVVAVSYSGDVAVVLSPGTITPVTTTFGGGFSPADVAIADLDGDGDFDLAVSNNGGDIELFAGDGAGAFTAYASASAGRYNQWILATDLDGDGFPDLVLVHGLDGIRGKVTTLVNDGTGRFPNANSYLTGGYDAEAVAAADLDGDGDQDIVAVNQQSSSISVLLGNGNGTLAPAVETKPGVPASANSIAIADVDADGIPDVAIGSSFNNNIRILSGDGSGGFAPLHTLHPAHQQVQDLRFADVDADGTLDLVVGNPVGAEVWWGDGNGSFSQGVAVVTGGYAPGALVGDFDGDGAVDLAAADSDGDAVQVALGRGGRMFVAAQYLGVVKHYNRFLGEIEAADLDGDGLLDLVVDNGTNLAGGTESLAVLLGTGQTDPLRWSAPVQYETLDNPAHTRAADLDGDGVLDLAWLESGGLGVGLGVGDGTFLPPTHFVIPGLSGYELRLADLDGDGDLDAAVSSLYSNGVRVLLNVGGGAFGASVLYATDLGPFGMDAGDIDGDGDIDLVTANYSSAGDTASLLVNAGNGTFAPPSNVALCAGGTSPEDIDLADLDADGDLDAIGTCYSSTGAVAVLVGNGNGTFAAAVRYAGGESSQVGAVGDFDGDGLPDVVVTNSAINGGASTWGLFVGNGNGTLQPMANFPSGGALTMTVADVDGDGDDDLLSTAPYDGGVQTMLQLP